VSTPWEQTDPILREIAERVLTAKELEVMKLLNAGYGKRRIATVIGIDVSTVRDRLDRAERKMQKELDKEEGAA